MGMIGNAGVQIRHNKTGIFGKMWNKRDGIQYASNRGHEVAKSEKVKAVIQEIDQKTVVAVQTRTTDLRYMSQLLNQLS